MTPERRAQLIYPVVDFTSLPGTTPVDDEDDSFFTGNDDWVERTYLNGDMTLASDPRVSPLLAPTHRGLAPAVICIGHHDPLLKQNRDYAAALEAAGVPAVLREDPDLVHGFFGMGKISVSAERAADQLSHDLRSVLLGVHV